jgi:cytochrome c-type biogenesis protein CcmH
MLWMILTVMTVLAAVGLAVPLIRKRDEARSARSDTLTVLREQLGELEAQSASGGVAAEEAEALKTDLKRRLLAEGRQADAPSRPLSEAALLRLAFGVVAVVAVGATGLYLKMGKPEVASAKPAAGAPAVAAGGDHPQGDVSSMIGQLEASLQQQPGNPEGWRMLGWSYLQTGRNADAAEAYGKAAALQPNNPEYLSAQGEATVLAADGTVTPKAEAIFRQALAVDPADPRARYFLAVGKDQRGDHQGAINDWIALLKSAPPDAPWAGEVRGFVEKVAQDRGISLAGRLPPAPSGAPAMASAQLPGPTAADVAAAQQMSEGDRQQMIEGMMAQLTEKLKANPRDRAGWERLMRSRMVMGQPQLAQAAYRDATRAFAGSASDQAALKQAAASFGVPGV